MGCDLKLKGVKVECKTVWIERYFIIEMSIHSPDHNYKMEDGFQYAIQYLLGDFETRVEEVTKQEFIKRTMIL
jgi:hypothetical protein